MRYFLEVSYDGLAFHGSQIQGSLPTIQLRLNETLSTLLRQPILTFGASRTDEGVHALGNFYHFDYSKQLPDNLVYRLNALLPFEISVKACFQSRDPENANARFDALSRQYRYRIYTFKDPFLYHRAYYYPYRIDLDRLPETASIIRQQENFNTFAKKKSQTRTFLCHIEEAKWTFEGNQFYFTVRANRFLRGMVRALVGTQLQVARQKLTTEEFSALFDKNDCSLADFSVPGFGLYLEKITYPEDFFLGVQL